MASSSSNNSSNNNSCSNSNRAAPSSLDAETMSFLVNSSKMNAADLQQLYSKFKRSQPNGSTSDFIDIVVRTHSSSEQLRKKANQFFQLFDRNRDCSISKEEVLAIMNTVFQTARDRGVSLTKTPEEVCEVFFSKLDTDHNSEISREEFVDGVLFDPDLLKILQDPEVMNTLSQ